MGVRRGGRGRERVLLKWIGRMVPMNILLCGSFVVAVRGLRVDAGVYSSLVGVKLGKATFIAG